MTWRIVKVTVPDTGISVARGTQASHQEAIDLVATNHPYIKADAKVLR